MKPNSASQESHAVPPLPHSVFGWEQSVEHGLGPKVVMNFRGQQLDPWSVMLPLIGDL